MSTETEAGFEARIRNGRTILTITGERNVAVIVQSRSGERIYLPPEDVVGQDKSDLSNGPYQPGLSGQDSDDEEVDSTSGRTETPYDRSGGLGMGRSGRLSGSRIVHHEPATDVRLLR
ncbi:DUF7510 family protein [Halapricum salinum]|uniref:Uncharacterized protein n=1 Tax=Halapricum salinum TaxID=1457250 RepID=A0A4D6HAS9_9EURY|nr:hypothetical protein [Halapricum salinum]QCC49877.1 hypothetical protein DV733_00955 [Halapricum salinum]